MKTTLYNHKAIGSDEKPLIPNVIFKGLMVLLKFDQQKDCEYILKVYELHPYQKQIYNNTSTNGNRNDSGL